MCTFSFVTSAITRGTVYMRENADPKIGRAQRDSTKRFSSFSMIFTSIFSPSYIFTSFLCFSKAIGTPSRRRVFFGVLIVSRRDNEMHDTGDIHLASSGIAGRCERTITIPSVSESSSRIYIGIPRRKDSWRCASGFDMRQPFDIRSYATQQ